MSTTLTLDRTSGLALYRQIAEQIKNQIADGRLPAGARLPTVRQLAETAGVSRLTVQNAYGELQSGGWIEATVGRGAFVSGAIGQRRQLVERTAPITAGLVIEDMLAVGHVEGMRSLANASPDPRLFPAEEFWGILTGLHSQASHLVEYGATQGDPGLRVELAKLVRDRGVIAMPDEVLITNGATQALTLATQALCRPGDIVLVEQPTYLSFLNILQTHGIQALSVPLDDDGPNVDALEQLALQTRPRFFYTMPTFHNPTGLCASSDRRRQILALAERYGFLVVEDDIYARMSYDAPALPALKSLDESGIVIYVSSFSKTLMPGLRLGYLIAPPHLLRRLVDLRRATDLCGPQAFQVALAEFLRRDGLKRCLRRTLPIYRERRAALLAALDATMPAGVSWTRPQGGFCCWMTLPPQPVFGDLYQAALRQGWAFAPGEVFLAQADNRQPDPAAERFCADNQRHPPSTSTASGLGPVPLASST